MKDALLHVLGAVISFVVMVTVLPPAIYLVCWWSDRVLAFVQARFPR